MSHAEKPTAFAAPDVSVPAGHLLRRLPLAGVVVGIVSLGVSAALYSGAPERFFAAYLVAFLYFLSLALGGLAYVLIMRAARAGSSASVRRLGEALMATLPLFVLLFVPVLLGLHHLYEWSRAEEVARDALLAHKRPYLNVPFFVARAAVYFLLWGGVAAWFYRRSLEQDRTGDHAITRRLQTAAPPLILAYGVTVCFAAVDWIMSLQPHWYSTIFGFYFFSGSFVGSFAVMSLLAVWLRRSGRIAEAITPHHLHDLGKWLFAFTVFWAYMAFSQYMLMWYGNIPEETIFFARRWSGGFKTVTVLLVLGHFALPFFLLLARDVKRSPRALALGAAWMLAAHLVDLYWLVMPAAAHGDAAVHLVDVTTFVGVGGLFVAALAWLLGRHAVVAVGDPRLPESLAFENE